MPGELFAVIRQAGLCRDNPTPFEFGSAFNHALVNILLRPPPNSNCSYDGDTLITTLNLFSSNMPTTSSVSTASMPVAPTQVSASHASNTINVSKVISSLPAQNTLCYIAGYVARN